MLDVDRLLIVLVSTLLGVVATLILSTISGAKSGVHDVRKTLEKDIWPEINDLRERMARVEEAIRRINGK